MRHLSLIYTFNRILAWLVLTVCALAPTISLAQAHTLNVSIRDVGDRELSGVTVIVHTEEGEEIARQSSDAGGMVRFKDLPSVVRVAVEGQARGGPQLYQLGDDAKGLRLELSDDMANLDLRVERDGLVLPDPATMLTLEDGGPLVGPATPLPTVVLATPALLLTVPEDASVGVVSIGATPEAEQPRHDGWVAPVTLLLIAAAACVLRLIQQLRSTR
jgi:hypothetical protein